MQPSVTAAGSAGRHVCFVALNAWPVLTGDRTIQTVGGAEAQQCTLARALVARGFRVSMICMNFGQPERVVIDGIEVYRAFAPDAGVPVVRFIHPRLSSIWSAMTHVDADIYYQRACGGLTGIVAAYCRARRKAFVYAAASDADFDRDLPLIDLARDRLLYTWGLSQADVIVVQSPAQQLRCRETFARPSQQIPSSYSAPADAHCDPAGYVLWVSTLRDLKRPEVFMELAGRLPQLRFRMVGGADHPASYEQLRDRAAALPNLDFVGFVPYADIERHFNGARVFVNTSEFEGFPNTFLQSWARGIPTVSFFDPGSRLESTPVVEVARSTDDMARLVSKLMADNQLWQETGARSREAFLLHHSAEMIATRYEALFDEILPHRMTRW